MESLAENLTDSVVSPLLYFALFGLPGALVYRAINTMDAMIGYRDEREYVGKAAARTDDVANWVPTRLAALLIVAVAALRANGPGGLGGAAHAAPPEHGPNKTLAIATMAGALGVQLREARRLRRRHRRAAAHRRRDRRRRLVVWVAGAIGRRSPPASRRCLPGAVWG